MKIRLKFVSLTLLLAIAMPADAQLTDDIKVLLVKQPGVSLTLTRDVLEQINDTLNFSGLFPEHKVSSAKDDLFGPFVYPTDCTQTDVIDAVLCIELEFKTERNIQSADVVIAVFAVLNKCGSTLPGTVNRPAISPANERYAYAVVEANCLRFPSNGIRVASHEIGHILSLEHSRDAPFKGSVPVGDNHAAEDSNDLTVMGEELGTLFGDCPLTNCAINDFLSENGRTFPDGGAAGSSSYANAKNVLQNTSWDIVAAYRPLQPPSVKGYAEPLGCNGNFGQFLNTWWALSTSTPVDSFEVQRKSGLYWDPYFSGGASCVAYTSSGNTDFRVRGINDAGPGLWDYYPAYHNCYGGGGGPAQ